MMKRPLASALLPLTVLCFLSALVSFANATWRAPRDGRSARRENISGRQGAAGEIELNTSDARLSAAFTWARRQALSYAFEGDPVGDWYEAALPGRQAFCMRDVSHQSMGAQALGLAPHSLNMLREFAANISDSKDWCSDWEIDRYGRPAPVDYQSDARFWYDLPANFDVLDACYRMYLWTGDLQYVEDPVFLNFYQRTVSDYVERWALDLGHVMKRERLMNIRGEFNPYDKFQPSRGIPGYDEGRKDFVVGVDLLAAEYAAYRDYSQVEALRGKFEKAEVYAKQARELKNFVNTTWWNPKSGHFYSVLDENHQLQGRNDVDVLYYGVAEDGPQAETARNDLEARVKANPSGPVERESHYPEVLFRYGAPDAAYSEIMDLARRGRYRREYPEVSFSVVGAIVTALMGINVDASAFDHGAQQWNYVETAVKTLPSLTKETAWAEIRNLPIRANRISVRQDGNQKTTFTNQSGPALIWRAAFPEAHETLLVDGHAVKASAGKEPPGRPDSWVQVTVGAGDTEVVEVPPSSTRR
jgi:hypothetical protein